MKAVVFAYNNIGCIGIEQLVKAGVTIQAVFTHADDPNENLWFRSVAETAASLGIPVFAPEDVNHPLWAARIKKILDENKLHANARFVEMTLSLKGLQISRS